MRKFTLLSTSLLFATLISLHSLPVHAQVDRDYSLMAGFITTTSGFFTVLGVAQNEKKELLAWWSILNIATSQVLLTIDYEDGHTSAFLPLTITNGILVLFDCLILGRLFGLSSEPPIEDGSAYLRFIHE